VFARQESHAENTGDVPFSNLGKSIGQDFVKRPGDIAAVKSLLRKYLKPCR
jgi:hypothetical protein